MSSSDSDNGESGIVPQAIREAAKEVSLNLLPDKSKRLYTAAYNEFKKWRKEQGSNSFCEDVLLVYFTHLAKSYAPSSLWSFYSMLRSTISTYNHIDISTYTRLQAFLKKTHAGYQAKKSKIFTKENISKFLSEAPDETYLDLKVSLIFGIAGALRRVEFVNLSINDVKKLDDENTLLIRIDKTKNNVPRSFTITEALFDVCFKYMQARPKDCSLDRFFLRYSNGKCMNQPIGINKFASMPKTIATFLKLSDANEFTGHSFRRTSATLLVDAGADLTTLQRHGGWKSGSVAYGYIADSISNKRKICDQISTGIQIKKVKPTVDEFSSPSNLNVDPPDQKEIQQRNQAHTSNSTFEINETISQNQIKPLSKFRPVIKSNIPVNIINEISQPQIKVAASVDTNEKDRIREDACTSNQDKRKEPKYPIFYHPDHGLCTVDVLNENVNKSFVFNNCNVTINCLNGFCNLKSLADKAVQTE